MSPLIKAKNISIEFPIYENSHRSMKNTLIGLSTGGRLGVTGDNGIQVVKAIDGIDFEFKEGERVGLLGHNGSGKTTLLRALSGVYKPVRGDLQVKGRVTSLLDISMGLDPDATGFENIFLRGIINGQKHQDILSHVDEIAEFSELGEYLNLPVRTYSSGMSLRLAFAISTSIETDILLMDEWLSVGDASFSQKAAKRMDELVGKASILVLASHSLELVNKVCNRIILLEYGRVVSDGPVASNDLPDESQPVENNVAV